MAAIASWRYQRSHPSQCTKNPGPPSRCFSSRIGDWGVGLCFAVCLLLVHGTRSSLEGRMVYLLWWCLFLDRSSRTLRTRVRILNLRKPWQTYPGFSQTLCPHSLLEMTSNPHFLLPLLLSPPHLLSWSLCLLGSPSFNLGVPQRSDHPISAPTFTDLESSTFFVFLLLFYHVGHLNTM